MDCKGVVAMNLIKLILLAIAIVFAILLGFSIIGFIYSALWYLFWVGVLVLGGYGAFRLARRGQTGQLEDRDSVERFELENAKIVKSLDEYKQKLHRK
jgi:hypothetical protein